MSSGNPSVTLTGWKAMVVLAAVVAFAGFRIVTARASLDTEGRAALERWVQAEVIRPILADSSRTLAERGQAVLEASSVSIRSLAARGPLDDMVVKVELEPNAAYPQGFELVRYYRMRYSTLVGWSHRGNTNVVAWYLALI